jgi:hypothetical protein
MKGGITWKPQYSTAFVDVGRRIAKADPPLWLLVGLTHFSADIGKDTSKYRQQFNDIVGQLSNATDVMLRWLPMFQHLGWGAECPDEIKVVLAMLPRIKADLDRLKPNTGRPKNARRDVCAAVVVEAWQLLHGKVRRRSEEQLYEACNDYWRACGGEEIGETSDRSNWRRAVETGDQAWIKSGLLAMKAIPELDRPAVQNST